MDQRFPIGGILVPTALLPSGRLCLANPEKAEAERYGGARAGETIDPYIIGSYRHPEDPNWTLVPRATLDALGLGASQAILNDRAQDVTHERVIDSAIVFQGDLRPYQVAAIESALAAFHGVIVMPPGAGKTVTSLALAVRLGLRPLVLVHTTDLMHQWIDSSTRFLGHPLDQIGAGKHTSGSPVGSVAMVQTITRWPRQDKEALALRHGVLLVDECHHTPAATILALLWHMGMPHRYGVSATPERADGLTPILYWTLGPVIHEVKTRDLVGAGVAVTPIVHRVDSKFDFALARQIKVDKGYSAWGKVVYWSKWKSQPHALLAEAKDVTKRNGRLTVRMVPEYDVDDCKALLQRDGLKCEAQVDSASLAEAYKALCDDQERIDLIVEEVRKLIAQNRKVLVLAGRVAYCQKINDWLGHAGIPSVVMTAQLSDKKRRLTLEKYKASEVMVCIATSLADEGLDVPDISGLVLAFPGRSAAKTIQRVGRTMRSVAGKGQPLIIDIVDSLIGMFVAQWGARRKAYHASGCEFGTGSDRIRRRTSC